MDLRTRYLGRTLNNPLVVSACGPLSEEIDHLRKMEDCGASAVTLYSLFEEQLRLEAAELNHHLTTGTDSFAEALSYFPEPGTFQLGPEEYLEHIREAKQAVDIPVYASLNGTTAGGWTKFARQIEQAGADALELNIYYIPTDYNLTGTDVERTYVDIVKAVKATVKIPVAVKLSPFFTNLGHVSKQLEDAGANGLILFNRFYQPDIDLEELEVTPSILLSTPQALRLPMRWIAILFGRVDVDLVGTSGIHTARDVLKMMMVGANATMLCSVLLARGLEYLRVIEREMVEWMEEHEYESVEQMQGSMSQMRSPDPSAFERAQYMRAITSYRPR